MSIIFNLNFQISYDLLLSTYICQEALFNWSSDINIWGWRWRDAKVFLLQNIFQWQLFQSSLQKFYKMNLRNRLRLVKTHIPQKISISRINWFLCYWFLSEREFQLISVCFETHITNLQKASESLFNTALVKLLYHLPSLRSYS